MTKPVRIITSWSPILLNRQHVSLSGEDQFGEHWVSTSIAELDVEARSARTISGRPYRMHGEPDPEYALLQAVSILSRAYELEGATIEAVTLEEADAWLRGQPEKPALSAQDADRGEVERRRQVWSRLRFQVMEPALSGIELAAITELPIDVIESLHRGVGSLGDLTTDAAEEGLGRLKTWRNRGWTM